MEFTIQRENLLKELQRLQGVVEKKNTIPILSNTYLAANKNELELVATDLEMGIRSFTQARVVQPGAITLSSKKLFEITRLLPEDEIRFEVEDKNWVQISCAKARFRIMGLPKDDFPPLPTYDFAKAVSLDLATLREMISKVLFATTADDTRYQLQGTLLILSKNAVTFVATDGHRLAFVTGKAAEGQVEKEVRVILPRKTLAEISRIDWEGSAQILFGTQENKIFLSAGRVTLVSSIVEGVFPTFEKVIPLENDKVLELGTQQLSDVVRRVSLLSNERSRAVKLSLQEGKIEVSSSNPEMGEARESLDVGYRGKEFEIGFNAKYLLDFLGAVGADRINLNLKDEQTQAMMTPASQGEQDYRYVVMPMRI